MHDHATRAATARPVTSAMRRRASGCSRCLSIPISASSGAGARRSSNLQPVRDSASKAAWYEAEQNLRNQIDRTYEAEMDFSLAELKTPGPGKGVSAPPDIDVRGFSGGGAQKKNRSRLKSAASGFLIGIGDFAYFVRVERPELGHRHPFRIAADLCECADRHVLLAGAEIGRAETDLRIVHVDLVLLDAGLDGVDRVVSLALTPELFADLDQRIALGAFCAAAMRFARLACCCAAWVCVSVSQTVEGVAGEKLGFDAFLLHGGGFGGKAQRIASLREQRVLVGAGQSAGPEAQTVDVERLMIVEARRALRGLSKLAPIFRALRARRRAAPGRRVCPASSPASYAQAICIFRTMSLPPLPK